MSLMLASGTAAGLEKVSGGEILGEMLSLPSLSSGR